MHLPNATSTAGEPCFCSVLEVMALGGRLNEEASLKHVEMLRSNWPLILNEPEDIDVTDDFIKPELWKEHFTTECGHTIALALGKNTPHGKLPQSLRRIIEYLLKN
ncbi:hypothetical protein AJ79_05227 [Helicocarpus griseus UAMH5409]|uniref:Uncharacterized protein n=1 Tax=Helicocarpus griseus UAMH5409 TaxID=1447875 RepID=A0A2B7XQT9_9EURO|nr:hypothetical protein AJ79_05227 [Helicocarpus griseus UAMH5409]